MSWVVAIDESGNLGKDTRFFTMTATIARRANHLKSVYRKIPKTGIESKFYNTERTIISGILDEFVSSDAKVAYVSVDKHDYKGRFYGKSGNALYVAVLSDLLESVSEALGPTELEIVIDKSSFISLSDLRALATRSLSEHGCTLRKIDKKDSEQSPCVQVADFIAGTVFRHYEHGDEEMFSKIRQKVVVARTD